MFDCQSQWLNGQAWLNQSQSNKALESWNSCLELGGSDPMLIFNYAIELEKQGQAIRSFQLLEIASRQHIYHPKLAELYQWLIDKHGFPGEISPLAWLNQPPSFLWSWFLSLILLMAIVYVLGKMSWIQNHLEKPFWFILKKIALSMILCSQVLLLVLLGLNLYEDKLNADHPTIIVAENTPLYEKSMGPEALISLVQGQKGRLEYPNDQIELQNIWPFQQLKKIKPEDRKRVKVQFSSGQSGYLWSDQVLPVEMFHE